MGEAQGNSRLHQPLHHLENIGGACANQGGKIRHHIFIDFNAGSQQFEKHPEFWFFPNWKSPDQNKRQRALCQPARWLWAYSGLQMSLGSHELPQFGNRNSRGQGNNGRIRLQFLPASSITMSTWWGLTPNIRISAISAASSMELSALTPAFQGTSFYPGCDCIRITQNASLPDFWPGRHNCSAHCATAYATNSCVHLDLA